MIQLHQGLLPDPQANAIREWLNHPGCHEFQRYVSSLAAAETAQAGNCLEKGEDDDRLDAEEHAKKARELTAVNNLIEAMRDQDYKFHPDELKPAMIKTT